MRSIFTKPGERSLHVLNVALQLLGPHLVFAGRSSERNVVVPEQRACVLKASVERVNRGVYVILLNRPEFGLVFGNHKIKN